MKNKIMMMAVLVTGLNMVTYADNMAGWNKDTQDTIIDAINSMDTFKLPKEFTTLKAYRQHLLKHFDHIQKMKALTPLNDKQKSFLDALGDAIERAKGYTTKEDTLEKLRYAEITVRGAYLQAREAGVFAQ